MTTNPYQPPQASAPLRKVATRSPSKPPRRIAILLGLIGIVPYWGFVAILLEAGGQDRMGGLILAPNGVLFIVLGSLEIIRLRGIWRSYGVLIVGQGVITAGMLVVGFGSVEPVLTINAVIITLALFLAGFAFGSERRQLRRRTHP